MISFVKFVRKLREIDENKEKQFHEFIQNLQNKLQSPSTAILFGSRSRKESSYLSDFDILLITSNRNVAMDYRSWALDSGMDLFIISANSLQEEFNRGNTILLDAVTEGIILFDELEIIESLKLEAKEYIHSHNLKKTKSGWIPDK